MEKAGPRFQNTSFPLRSETSAPWIPGEFEMADRNALPYPQAPVGIGGWLSFFVTVMIVFRPLLTAGSYLRVFQTLEEATPGLAADPSYAAFSNYVYTLTAVAGVLCASAGVLLCLRRRWGSVKYTIWILWLSGPVLLLAFGLYGAGHENLLAKLFCNPFDLMSSCVFPAIWSAYLLLSKRVKNTYPRL